MHEERLFAAISSAWRVQDLLNGNVNYVIIDAAPAECIVKALNAAN